MNTAFRYFRPSKAVPIDNGEQLKVFHTNMGGVTAYIVFDDNQNIKVSFAVCREDENFDKEIGRVNSRQSYERGDFVSIPAMDKTKAKRRLVDYVFGYLKSNYYDITTVEQRAGTIGTVKKMMNHYISNVDCSSFGSHEKVIKSFLIPLLDPVNVQEDHTECDPECTNESCTCAH